MYQLSFFSRKTNPAFFSLERVFGGITGGLRAAYAGEFEIREWQMPFYSKPAHIRENIRFTTRHQTGINHITGDVHYALLGCSRKNINILTIHDCVPLHKYSRWNWRYWLLKWLWYSWPVGKADRVTVISENTREEVIRLTGADPAKIVVIPNFIDPAFTFVPAVFHAERPRILFVGTTPNKNLGALATALAGIPAVLDIIGELSPEQEAGLKRAGITYEQSSRLSAEAVRRKYSDCDLIAFPSTYEGFGLPILEAQATGRPVLTSDIQPMKGIAGDAAFLADPLDPLSIREGLMKIIGDANYRSALIEAGLRNVERFRLEEVTKQYAALYREMITQKTPACLHLQT